MPHPIPSVAERKAIDSALRYEVRIQTGADDFQVYRCATAGEALFLSRLSSDPALNVVVMDMQQLTRLY